LANCCVGSKDLMYFCLFYVFLYYPSFYVSISFFFVSLFFLFLPFISLSPVFSLSLFLLNFLFYHKFRHYFSPLSFSLFNFYFPVFFPLTLYHFSMFSLFVYFASCLSCFSFRTHFFFSHQQCKQTNDLKLPDAIREFNIVLSAKRSDNIM
jgi:hypothetical protein